jgi:hypothetical protein
MASGLIVHSALEQHLASGAGMLCQKDVVILEVGAEALRAVYDGLFIVTTSCCTPSDFPTT